MVKVNIKDVLIHTIIGMVLTIILCIGLILIQIKSQFPSDDTILIIINMFFMGYVVCAVLYKASE